jgi:hypothetical protein
VNSFFLSSATGRIALLLLGLDILLPYVLRRTRLSEFLGLAQGNGAKYLHRMWPHYWCGYLLLFFSAAHTWISMQAGGMKRANITGLWLATIALCLLLFQSAIGLLLQDRALQPRKLMRGWHYWIMIALAGFVAAHIWLNG